MQLAPFLQRILTNAVYTPLFQLTHMSDSISMRLAYSLSQRMARRFQIVKMASSLIVAYKNDLQTRRWENPSLQHGMGHRCENLHTHLVIDL